MNKRETGNIYEKQAESIIINKGYHILKKNYKNRRGEIDIIASINREIVFIEVKYRKTNLYGEGLESINKNKMRKIFYTALYYISQNNLRDFSYRFDCISFLDNEVKWLKNVIWGDEFGLQVP
ncbi:YraN family protein [Fusobacterium sp. PH5-44]|uniref:YraN family protein n=1 Tax=unclassified Fusobacterium TaxID=2648384 RepID=UPI003D1AAD17